MNLDAVPVEVNVCARVYSVCLRSRALGIPPRDKNSFAFHMSAYRLSLLICSAPGAHDVTGYLDDGWPFRLFSLVFNPRKSDMTVVNL